MSIKDQIRAEIERRNLANYCGTAEQYEEELFAILDTLPEQPVEGLEEKDFVEEVRQYYSNNCTWDALKQPMLSIITRCARHFAEWGAEHARKEGEK